MDVFRALNKKRVRYVVVGGVAVVLHGIVRLTADLDLMIDLQEKNTGKFLEAMTSLGYKPKVPVAAGEFNDPEKRAKWKKEKNMIVFSFYDPKKPFAEVDVFIDNPLDYQRVSKNKKIYKIAGLSIPLVSLEDLKELKKLSGRAQDEADINALCALEKLRNEKKEVW
jgi:hypothetical protein